MHAYCSVLSRQRCQTIQALQITPDAMQLTDSKCTFDVNSLLKHCPDLFVTLLAPHTAAVTDTICRWLKETLAGAGVDTSVFTAHSTWSASTSAVKDSGTPINVIMGATGWTNASTFTKFYQKMTDTEKNFGQAIMTRYQEKR